MRNAVTAGVAVATLVIGLVVGALAFSGSTTDTTPPSAGNAPAAVPAPVPDEPDASPMETVSLEPATYDFGPMLEGEFRTTTLAVKRPDDAKLRITRVYSPCPCLFVTTGKRIVEPGEQTHVKVDLHSLTLSGKVSFPVYVEVAEPEKGVLRADVTMDVTRVPAQMMIKPDTMHLGLVRGASTAEVTLMNLTRKPITLRKTSTTIEGAEVSVVEGLRIDAGRTHTVRLAIDGSALSKGPIRGDITIETSCPAHRVIAIPVDGTAR